MFGCRGGFWWYSKAFLCLQIVQFFDMTFIDMWAVMTGSDNGRFGIVEGGVRAVHIAGQFLDMLV